jgi:glycosyltransferase involved in cell wall biosynthesis
MQRDAVENEKVLVTLFGYVPTLNEAPSSRALYLFSEIKKVIPDTFIIMRKGDDLNIEIENLVQVDPVMPLKGSLVPLGNILFRLHATVFISWFAITKRINCAIVRGYDTVFLILILKLIGVKIFYDFHGLYYKEISGDKRHLRAFLVKHMEKMILALSDIIIVISEGARDQINAYGGKCLLLPNGIDMEIFNKADGCSISMPFGKRIIGFIGNWEPDKKVEDICESIGYLDNCVAVLVGLGYNADELRDKYHKNEKIKFTGILPPEEAYALLKKFDVCILPYDINSPLSGCPGIYSTRKAKDYIAAGKPIVVSDVPARETWLVEGWNCLVYESGNPKDLAKKIQILLNDLDLKRQMGENNRMIAEKFTWESVINDSGLVQEILQVNSQKDRAPCK